MSTLEERIKLSIEKIRPYLKIDGGDVELKNISNDGIVEVQFLGNCKICPLSSMTLRAGVERTILIDNPEVKRVELD
ncbi:MAG: NifU family protein [Bacteroidota bacterium]